MTQCNAITSKKERCKRIVIPSDINTFDDKIYCFVHLNNINKLKNHKHQTDQIDK